MNQAGLRAPAGDPHLQRVDDQIGSHVVGHRPADDPPREGVLDGDAYDNAMAESFVDTFKTELVADRSWRSRSRLELAVVEYVSWFNHERLHESLGDRSPVEFEDLYVRQGSN